MRETILVPIGTAPGGVGLDFLRRYHDHVAWLEKLRDTFPVDRREAIRQEIEDLRGGVFVKAFDVDATNVYNLNAPPNVRVSTWPVGTFSQCERPGPAMVAAIMAGDHRGRFENLNAESARALGAAENGSGGSRSNGRLCAEINEHLIDEEIRRCIVTILTRRRVLGRSREEHVRVILLTSTFGGFASGSTSFFRQRILSIAQEMQVQIDLVTIVLVPGTNQSKDPENTLSGTCGFLDEEVAQGTQAHWHRRKLPSSTTLQMVKSSHGQIILVSDTNHAPGDPKALSMENFTSMVGELLRLLILTPLGSRIDALAGDFNIPSRQLTPKGEPRIGRSIGLAQVHLDRPRLLDYAVNRMASVLLTRSLEQADPEDILQRARVIFEAHRLVQGGGFHQLSDLLLKRGDDSQDLVDLERFRELLRQNTAGLRGVALLRGGAARVQLSLRQAGDLPEALARRSEAALDGFRRDLVRQSDDLARDTRAGFAVAHQLVQTAVDVSQNMVDQAFNDTPRYDQEIEGLQPSIDYLEKTYFPAVQRMNFLLRVIHRRSIRAAGDRYLHLLESREVARMRQAAHLRAIEVLRQASEIGKARLTESQAALDAVTAERNSCGAECERLANHPPDFGCPVGLSLLDAPAFDSCYQRILPDGGEEVALEHVRARLLQVQDAVVMAGDQDALHRELVANIEAEVLVKVRDLHVLDELRRRFPNPAELGAVLRERSRESFEYVQLRDSCDQENPVRLVRLIGADNARVGELMTTLGQYDYPRPIPYQLIHVDDPDRVSLIQYRAVYPCTDWAHMGHARDLASRIGRSIHPVPTDHALPVPGRRPTLTEARQTLFRAWVLRRLEFDASTRVWSLISADGTESPIPLGPDLDVLRGQEGYLRAVDIASHYGCEYLKNGPGPIREALRQLSGAGPQNGRAAEILEMSRIADAEIRRSIEAELERFLRNSVPAAMEWGESDHPVSMTPGRSPKRGRR